MQLEPATKMEQLKTTINQSVNEMFAAFTNGVKSVDIDLGSFLNELDQVKLNG